MHQRENGNLVKKGMNIHDGNKQVHHNIYEGASKFALSLIIIFKMYLEMRNSSDY